MRGEVTSSSPLLWLEEAMRYRWDTFGVRVRMSLTRHPPLLVYSFGKSGSSTIAASLAAASSFRPVLQVHRISADGIAWARARHEPPFPRHLRVGESVRRWLDDHPDRRVTVVSSVREPIARALSDLRQNVARTDPDTLDAAGRLDLRGSERIVRERLEGGSTVAYLTRWLDEELRTVTGIDVFQVPFDIERGWVRTSSDRFDLYVLRAEDLDRVGPSLLADILGQDGPVELEVRNLSRRSADADAYRMLVQRFTLSEEALHRILESRYVRHFYPDHVEHIIEKWSASTSG